MTDGTARPLVWLASYPKSGNTWLRALLAGLAEPDQADARIALAGEISSDRARFDALAGIAAADLLPHEVDLLRPAVHRALAATSSDPIFIKTHEGYAANQTGEPIFPADCSRGAVLIVRHPLDVAVSLAHHRGDPGFDPAIAQMADVAYVAGGTGRAQLAQRTGGWSDFHRSWLAQNAIPLLVVRYEDLLAETARELTRFAAFLALKADGARVSRAVELARFERLRALEDRHGFAERPLAAARFFRAGRAGEGATALSADQRARVLRDHAATMAALGYSTATRTSLQAAIPDGSRAARHG